MKIKVLVIDDSSLIRGIITAIVNEQADMVVVGGAPDPLAARDMIRTLNPDVLTLDIEMPHMNGLSFLKRLMRVRPMPVGDALLAHAARLGHRLSRAHAGRRGLRREARSSARAARRRRITRARSWKRSAARMRRATTCGRSSRRARPTPKVVLPALGNDALATSRVVVMGASTGGAEALREMMPALPADCPPVLVSLHMPAAFTRHLAGRLDDACKVTVKVPVDGEPAMPGHVYLAPGDAHMTVQRYGSRGFGIRLHPGAARPSVDMLFRSAAEHGGADAIGVILTGQR
jgi:two-component system chemotaxis response regulator CheB